jgi:hypothetical protein
MGTIVPTRAPIMGTIVPTIMGTIVPTSSGQSAFTCRTFTRGAQRARCSSLISPSLSRSAKAFVLGLRGSSAKRDSPETVLALLADQDENGIRGNYRMAMVKIRDGMEGRIIPYRLEEVTLGVDPDGDPITTKLVRFEPDRKLERQATRRGRPAKQTDDKLEAAAVEVGGWPADPTALRRAFYRLHGGTAGAKRVAWLRAKASLRAGPDGRLDVAF